LHRVEEMIYLQLTCDAVQTQEEGGTVWQNVCACACVSEK
jgi:hypothetical protein